MSQRRTRAMGLSPGGFKSLDMDAPTRKPRKAKVAQDTEAPASNASRAKPATKAKAKPKRKGAPVVKEGPSPKRPRHDVAASTPERTPKPISPLYHSYAKNPPRLPISEDKGYIFHLPENPAVSPESNPSSQTRGSLQEPSRSFTFTAQSDSASRRNTLSPRRNSLPISEDQRYLNLPKNRAVSYESNQSSQTRGSPQKSSRSLTFTSPQESTSGRTNSSPLRSRLPISEDQQYNNLLEESVVSYDCDQSSQSRGNQQEPSSPTDLRNTQKRNARLRAYGVPSPTPEEAEELRRESRIAQFMSLHPIEPEEEVEEKPLSDCDDDEWARRLPLQMLGYRTGGTPRLLNTTHVSWIPGAKAMFSVRGDEYTHQEGKPRMNSIQFSPPNSPPQRLATSARPLTKLDVIAAVSASIDWFENNPSAIPPTAAEMASLLDDFIESKAIIAKPRDSPSVADLNARHDPSPVADRNTRGSPSHASNTNPQTPTRRRLFNDNSSEGEADSPNGRADHGITSDNHLGAREPTAPLTQSEDRQGTPIAPNTPARQQPQQEEPRRTWATVLSASAISSVLRTPATWFSRRGGAPIAPASEPRPAASVKPPRRVRAKSKKSAGRRRKLASAKSSIQGEPSSAHPVPPPSPCRRTDAHLPVHLRGVRYEDLPREWQAVSQHLKPSDPPAEDDEEVDLEALYAQAEENRRMWGLKPAREEGEVAARASSFSEEEEYDREQPVGSKRKVTVRFTNRQPKVFSAKLGPGTFGLPLNIDDSSSEEEVEVEYDDDEPGRIPRQSDHRAASPVKSCMKGSRNQPLQSSSESSGSEAEGTSRPLKRARHDDSDVTVNWSGDLGDEDYRARPSTFISTPESEATKLLDDRDDYEELHPLTSDDPEVQADLNLLFALCMKGRENSNVFKLEQEAKRKQEAQEHEEAQKRREQKERRVQEPAILEKPILRETALDRLNKLREKAVPHKPAVPSGLHITQIMSPIHSPVNEKMRMIGSTELDPEVIAALDAIPDSEITAYSFAHIPYKSDSIVSDVPPWVFKTF